MGAPPAPPPCSWKSFLVVGVLFPLHIVAGVLTWPVLLILLVRGSTTALVLLLLYTPLFLFPAQRRMPGWKGAQALWRWFDYERTCPSYFGTFGLYGAKQHIDPHQQYVVASHPHGTVIFQRTYWQTELLGRFFERRGWRMIGASVIFRIPIVRELSLLFGAIDADKAMCEKVLRSGTNLVVFPGGLDEANTLGTTSGDVRIKTRTGFIRLAIKHGVPVLPTFTFGELDAVDAVALLPPAATQWVKRNLRMSTTFFAGRWGTFIPKRVPFNMCVGAPIPVTKMDPSETEVFAMQVERVHEAYKSEIQRLYEENKRKFGYDDRPLVFI